MIEGELVSCLDGGRMAGSIDAGGIEVKGRSGKDSNNGRCCRCRLDLRSVGAGDAGGDGVSLGNRGTD